MPLKKGRKGESKASKRTKASQNIRELKKAHPEWSQERIQAASLRSAGLSKRKRKGKR